MDKKSQPNFSRRNFLLSSGKSLATFAAANVGVYVIGSAFKNLDGSLVAGAKCADFFYPPACAMRTINGPRAAGYSDSFPLTFCDGFFHVAILATCQGDGSWLVEPN